MKIKNIINFIKFKCVYLKNWLHRFLKFKNEFDQFSQMTQKEEFRFEVRWQDRYPCLDDRTNTVPFDQHYLYHPAWAARVLAAQLPEYHIDISSTLYFCTIASAFIPIKYYEFRPPNIHISNLEMHSVDLNALPFTDNSIKSLSCMHTIEHIGLGRYGDTLDPNGDLKAINELIRVLDYGGDLLIVVPIGKPQLLFNAHRIYSYCQIRDYFKNLILKEFVLIPDNAFEIGIIYNPSEDIVDKQNWGCGCFWFQKPPFLNGDINQ